MKNEAQVARAPRRETAKRWLTGLALIGLLVTGARLAPWSRVFTSEGVLFPGNDAYYHLLRTQRTVEQFPRVPAHDPWMDYPAGATIPWPPLFDLAVTSTAMAAGLGDPSPRLVEKAGAIFPVLPGLLTLVLVAFLAHMIAGRGLAVRTIVLLGLLPAHVAFSSVGRLDQHVAEVLVFSWLMVASLAGCRAERGGRAWLADASLGLGIAVAFWTWLGSGLHLLFLVAFTGAWTVVAAPGEASVARAARSLTRGCGIGAVLLVLSMMLCGRSDALSEMSVVGLTGFHVVMVGASAAFGAAVWVAGRWTGRASRRRRAGGALSAAVVTGAVTFVAFPSFRDAVVHGLTALSKGNAWYRNIQEFDPLLFAGFETVTAELASVAQLFGLTLLFLPVAAVRLVRICREDALRRTAAFMVLAAAGGFMVLAFYSQRFSIYFAVPLAIATALAWESTEAFLVRRVRLGVRLGRRVARGLFIVVCLAPCLFWYADRILSGPDRKSIELHRTLRWLRERQPAIAGREAVLAEWSYGHHIEYSAKRPVLVNPFGTDLGRAGMEDSARFFLSRDPREVERLLERRRIGFVLLKNPATEIHFAHAFAPPGTPPAVEVTRDWPGPYRVAVMPGFHDLIATRLYFREGMTARGYGEALGRVRLVYESRTLERPPARDVFKVFEVVTGATIRAVTGPGQRVDVRTRLRTNQDREVHWLSSGVADESGTALLRVPYATGMNGLVDASPYEVTAGRESAALSMSASDVLDGGTRTVRLRR